MGAALAASGDPGMAQAHLAMMSLDGDGHGAEAGASHDEAEAEGHAGSSAGRVGAIVCIGFLTRQAGAAPDRGVPHGPRRSEHA